MLCLKSESPRRPIGQRIVALVTVGSLVSACAPTPPPLSLWNYQPGRMPPPVAYQAPATPTVTYAPPVAVQSAPVPAPQQPARSNLADDAIFGAAGYVAGRQIGPNTAVPGTAAAVAGTTETTVARTVTLTADTAAVIDVASTAVTDAVVTDVVAGEGAEAVAGAVAGDLLLPAIVIGAVAYFGYLALTNSQQGEGDHKADRASANSSK
jgi:hypothetical protein